MGLDEIHPLADLSVELPSALLDTKLVFPGLLGGIFVGVAILLLAPSPPLLFMGEEFRCLQPFLFFCDFGPDLARSVTEGRRKEFAKFPEFREPLARKKIPDPSSPSTFQATKLDWNQLKRTPHEGQLTYYRKLLDLRRKEIVPRLKGIVGNKTDFLLIGARGLTASWVLADGSKLTLVANLGDEAIMNVQRPTGCLLFETEQGVVRGKSLGTMPAWSAAWFIESNTEEGK